MSLLSRKNTIPRRKNAIPGRPARPALRGFTFLEIMMVVMIIGIMLAVVGPKLVGRSKKAQINATRQQMANLKTALGLYEMEIGSFPTSEQGLEALITRPADVSENDWSGYWEKGELPRDAWGEEFLYRCPSEHGGDYDLVSMGPDRKEGTEDDITNYNKSAEN